MPKFKLDQVPREQRITDDEWLEDSEKENCSLVKESMSSMEDARFGTKLTGEKELEVCSKGFLPKNMDSNTTNEQDIEALMLFEFMSANL